MAKEVQLYVNDVRLTGEGLYVSRIDGLYSGADVRNRILDKSSGGAFFTSRKERAKDITLGVTVKADTLQERDRLISDFRRYLEGNQETETVLQVGTYLLISDFESTYTNNTGTYTSVAQRVKGAKSTRCENDIDITFSSLSVDVFDVKKVRGFVWIKGNTTNSITGGTIKLTVEDTTNSVTLEAEIDAQKIDSQKWVLYEFGDWSATSGSIEDFETVETATIKGSSLTGTIDFYVDNLALQDFGSVTELIGTFGNVTEDNDPRAINFKRLNVGFSAPRGHGRLVGLDFIQEVTVAGSMVRKFPIDTEPITHIHSFEVFFRRSSAATSTQQYYELYNQSSQGFRFFEDDYSATEYKWFGESLNNSLEAKGKAVEFEGSVAEIARMHDFTDDAYTEFRLCQLDSNIASAVAGSNEGQGTVKRELAAGFEMPFDMGATARRIVYIDVWIGNEFDSEAALVGRIFKSSVLQATSETVYLSRGVARKRFFFDVRPSPTGVCTFEVSNNQDSTNRFFILTTTDTTLSTAAGSPCQKVLPAPFESGGLHSVEIDDIVTNIVAINASSTDNGQSIYIAGKISRLV
jgi:hypothetical protein